jgi:hypothetical protein
LTRSFTDPTVKSKDTVEVFGLMRSPITVGRSRISLKASHHRFSLKVSHRRDAGAVTREPEERERYIAPPKRRR